VPQGKDHPVTDGAGRGVESELGRNRELEIRFTHKAKALLAYTTKGKKIYLYRRLGPPLTEGPEKDAEISRASLASLSMNCNRSIK
jgi:hypothetical protein